MASWTVAALSDTSIGVDVNANGRTVRSCSHTENSCTGDDSLAVTGTDTWGVSFNYGDVIGQSLCYSGSINPNNVISGEVSYAEDGTTCLCKMTSLANQSYVNSWVSLGSTASCPSSCAEACATEVKTSEDFRKLIFGIN